MAPRNPTSLVAETVEPGFVDGGHRARAELGVAGELAEPVTVDEVDRRGGARRRTPRRLGIPRRRHHHGTLEAWDLAELVAHYERVRVEIRPYGDALLEAVTTMAMAWVVDEAGDLERARSLAEEGIEAGRRAGHAVHTCVGRGPRASCSR